MALLTVVLLAVAIAVATAAARRSRTVALASTAGSLPPPPSTGEGAEGDHQHLPVSWEPERQSAGMGCWLPIVFVVAQFIALVVIALIGMNEAGYDICDTTYAPPSSMDRQLQRAVALASLLPFVVIAARSPRRAWWILIPVLLCGAVWASVLRPAPAWDPASVRESCGIPSS